MKVKALQKSKDNYQTLLDSIVDLVKNLVEVQSLTNLDGIIDFSSCLFVLPTKEASRIFREKIAEVFEEHGGVLSLNTVLPEYFLYSTIEGKTVLNQGEIAEIWYQVLDSAYRKDDNGIFKNSIWEKNSNNSAWKLGVCKMFQRLRKDVALEKGMSCAELYENYKDLAWDMEGERNSRFQEFLGYEKLYMELKGDNFCDEADLILHNIHRTELDNKEIKKIIFLDCCELKNSVIKVLENLQGCEIELYLNVSNEELGFFDEYGHVRVDKIKEFKLDLDFEKQVRVYDKPIDMANKIFKIIRKNIDNLPSCIGVLSAEIGNYLEFLTEEYNERNPQKTIGIYAPESGILSKCPWTKLFMELLALDSNFISFEQIAALCRNGLVSNYFAKKIENFHYQKFLQILDTLQAEHLLDSFDNLRFFADKSADEKSVIIEVLNTISSWQKMVKSSDNKLLETWQVLSEIGAENDLETVDYDKSEMELNELKKMIVEFDKIKDEELKLKLFEFSVREKTLEFKGDNGEVINLAGFLELSWVNDKKLLIAGMNEENFNCVESNNMFIPEKTRELLGFTAQKERHAADIYRFYALNKSHELGIMVANSDNGGNELKAARLLFYLPNDKLVNAASLIFEKQLHDEVESNSVELGKKYFKYQLNIDEYTKKTISVSGMKTYLDCPFKFYLQQTGRLEKVNDRNLELDFLNQGTIIHEILEKFVQKDIYKMPVETWNGFFSEQLTATIFKYLGRYNNALIDIQMENMKKILQNFIFYQIEYMQGKSQLKTMTEIPFKVPLNEFFSLNEENYENIIFSGKIDRVDTFYENGRKVIQLFDYKTTIKEKEPFSSHISGIKKSRGDEFDWQNFSVPEIAKKQLSKCDNYYFKDVQLPLYYAIVKKNLLPDFDTENCEIRVAYFCLAVNRDVSGIKTFDECSAFVSDAEEIMRRVCDRVFVEQKFLPLNLKSQYKADVLTMLGNVTFEDFEECNKGGKND